MTELELVDHHHSLPARMGTADAALEMLLAHDRVMGVAHKLAKNMVNTALVPVAYRGKAEDATAAILYGAELGLSPIQSLQNVVNIHGRPSLEARTMVALLQAKGYRFRTVESTDESVTVECTTPDGRTEPSTWTIDRAKKAGYVSTWDEAKGDWVRNDRGKIVGNTKYHTDPRAMLWAKAAAELARHLAPDVLLGIAYTREDLESEPEPDPAPVRATSERLDRPAPAATAGPATVQDWTPPAPEDGSTAVVSEPTAETPESDSEPETPQGAAPTSLQGRRTKKSELDEIGDLMDALKLEERADRQRLVREMLGDDTITANTMNPEQRGYVLTELRGLVAQRRADAAASAEEQGDGQ
ncbi:hypothetical protein [Nocardia puris]|uniref:RecT family protein n=1 Tax=Nocardia puris TaxID=208602 RepID=A0A366DC12_9NOCA|nr:hypothetical protein [Nocardia puris]RBO87556.1 hypothetical protein DFR74_111263 [Nocardia puris]